MVTWNFKYLTLRLSRCYSVRQPIRTPRSLPRPARSVLLSRPNIGIRTFYSSRILLDSPGTKAGSSQQHDAASLPVSCPGCGALTQWVDNEQAGYYSISRNAVKTYIRETIHDLAAKPSENESNTDIQSSPQVESEELLAGSKFSRQEEELKPNAPRLPLCDRCNNLVNHKQAQPIPYPPISYIRDLLKESPWHSNHVYHILDAADFPLSLIPDIYRNLSLQPQRSRNRRSSTVTYRAGRRQADLHFIITRADLLGATKEHVDLMMTYMTRVLRDALVPDGEDVRLGNIHMVSAYRGWWTPQVKDKIWKEGGGVWMVGKTNVGKSNLISAVFPKSIDAARRLRKAQATLTSAIEPEHAGLSDDALLPPVQEQYDYPVLPVISSLPGTTASPIRLPFGMKKGEVIDLPGLSRGDLTEFVQNKYALDLIMKKRPKPDRFTIKPGQSFLLGDLVRITPVDPLDVFLVSPFLAMDTHVTSTSKAIEILSGKRTPPYTAIAKEDVKQSIVSAGIFDLSYDVTKIYGKRISEQAQERSESHKPLFKMMSVDILIEGCGWVEIVTQVRTKDLTEESFPRIEVFSPEGRCIGSRRPMSAYAPLFEKRRKDAKKAGRPMRYRRSK